MNEKALMQMLLQEMQVRRDAGFQVQFWLRDDDAIEPSNALSRFTDLTDAFSLPATLAVIPVATGEALRSELDGSSLIDVAVHGWSHENHAPQSEKKQELGTHRPIHQVVDELRAGFDKLSDLYPESFVPLLVPPWNRIADDVVVELSDIGFESLSVFGAEKIAPLRMINTHVDLIDWRGSRGGRDTEQLVSELIAAIRLGISPIGFLTHHLVHDDAAWQFMELFFEATTNTDLCRWVSIKEILQSPLPDPRLPA